ncbi:MAG: NAD(P)-binding protein [Acetobacter sp.]|jgi:NADPH-dependent glutamate synthase beta subunit-like oxidoreductase|nr:NAD(P)-binding protein [Acetobacter sp.]MCH4060124.1 NAD(P)-binding protein [Acetobacter sp.]MCH4087064.1 NAD(P)-binding protein [Acetobacter sp.]MCI1292884.1 NAD(P)-binding protein [Acetobacter sp.]MCI1319470.1 NAD(P)-binding protein [Acetobacter sp.]
MPLKLHDLSQMMQETTLRGVGSRRWQHPEYVAYLPPCNHACPAGENIQSWLALAQAGRYEEAWCRLMEENPLPAIHGRACYHPCESACNRSALDEAVAIHDVERFLGDLALKNGWKPAPAPATGRKVLIVGAGPAGLSCAWHLALKGHAVEIRDSSPEPGGMMAHGIPSYRLPRDIVSTEIARIADLPGVTLRMGTMVRDVARAKQEGGFDAVFVAVGAALANHLNIPASDGRKFVDGIDLLAEAKEGRKPQLGRVVAIIGGGNVAMDSARTARRLGAQETLLVFRYDPQHMEALPSEANEAFVEGTKIRWLSVIDHFGAGGITVEKVRMNPDGSVTPTGETQTLAADSVVMAVGQHSDLSLVSSLPDITVTKTDTIFVDDHLMTGHAGIFAGGDCIGGARTMTAATGHGKHAAREIDAFLAGTTWEHPPSNPLVTFEMLHLPDYLDAPRTKEAERPLAERGGFDEVIAGFDGKQARREAARCLSCGNCFECDNCFASCPEQAITRLGPGKGYDVSLELCTGCSACAEQCPCHAIEMAPEAPDRPEVTGSLGEPVSPAKFAVRA